MKEFIMISDIDENLACDFKAWLDKLDESDAKITILSHGGLCFVGTGIGQMILHAREKGVRFTADVYGICASAASAIALSCDNIRMAEGSQLMIHSAWLDYGNADDEGISRANDAQLEIIRQKLPQYTAEELKTDRWISASEAKKLGIADLIKSEDVRAACSKIAAKYNYNDGGRIMADERIEKKIDENIQIEAPEEEKQEVVAEEGHSAEDVLEAIVERLDAIEHRLGVLEGEGKKQDDELVAECGDDKQDRLNALYARLLKPSAAFKKAKAASNEKADLADFKKRVNISDYIR